MQVFVTINKDRMKANADVNVQKLIDKGMCDKGFIWNSSNCECEYDKPCDVREYLDYKNCKCIKKLVDKLVECIENIDETLDVIPLDVTSLNDYSKSV